MTQGGAGRGGDDGAPPSGHGPSGDWELARWRAQQRWIDVLCQSFEAALGSDPRVTLDQFLRRHVGEIRLDLFRQLLLVELERAASFAEPPELADYLERYPDRAEQVGWAFARASEWGLVAPVPDLELVVAQATSRHADQRIGDYRVLRELGKGEGALATVYLAEDLAGRIVAVKVSDRPSLEPHLLVRLDHPQIVKLHHYSRLEGEPPRHLLCMEYVPSISLRAALEALSGTWTHEGLLRALAHQLGAAPEDSERPSWTPPEMPWPMYVAWLGAQLADALAYAHRHHVLHRDLKPANILLDRHARPTLVDFNVSFTVDKQGHADMAPVDHFGGSLPYMAPEHLAAYAGEDGAADVGPAADVYALGVVLFELLAGRRPVQAATFAAPTVAAAVARLRDEIATRSPEFPDSCPDELRWTLGQCLQLEPARRPEAAEVARRLRHYGSPELQRRVVPDYWAWVRARPRFAATLYIGALLTLCFLPTLAVQLLGALLYPSLVLLETPGALEVWDPQAAWRAGGLWGTLGVVGVLGFALWHVAPALVAIVTTERAPIAPERAGRVATRCMSVGLAASAATVLGWIVVGLAVPWSALDRDAAHRGVELIAYLWQSTLHGLLGFTPTFLMSTYLAVDFLVLRLIPRADLAGCRRWLPTLRRAVVWGRLATLVAGGALLLHVLARAPLSPAVQDYIVSLLIVLLGFAALNEFWSRRLESVLDIAVEALRQDRV